MRRDDHLTAVLKSGGFALHGYLGRWFKVGFLAQCCLTALFAAAVILTGSFIDGSLILPGRSVGLLEHPGIWIFFVLQIALPLSIKRSLNKLLAERSQLREIATSRGAYSDLVNKPLFDFLRLKTVESRLIATILYSVGVAAFVWNTYQDELPGIVLPYDFWDSKNFLLGFWLTRVYRLYMLCWLLPYIGMVHIAILTVVLRLIRQARISGKLKLILFHPDGVGGLGFVPGLVTTPIVVTVLVSSISTAAAFEVHRAADVTPIMGLSVIVLATLIAYVIPIFILRTDILAMKRSTIEKLRLLQQAYYTKIVESEEIDFEKVRKGNEALDYFEKVCRRIQGISNFPHLKRVLGYLALAITPSIASLIIKSLQDVAPIIRPLLKKP
jgi:hypothetical protein